MKKTFSKFLFFDKLFPNEEGNSAVFLFLIFLLYAIVAGIGMMHHEMWRDEIEPWLIASESKTLTQFFDNMKMGSNPYVWYLILHFLSSISLSPIIVQVAHFVVALGSAYLVLRYSPFTLLQKLFLCFSYYLLYEFAIISRGYALTIFFIFLFCTFFKKYWDKGIPLAVVIFFLANATGGFGAILSISFLMFLVANYLFNEMSEAKKKQKIKYFGWTVTLILISIWVAIKSISPPEDSIYANFWYFEYNVDRVFSILWRVWLGYIPVPDMSTINFWNSNIIDISSPSAGVRLFLTTSSLLFLLYGVLMFSKRISVLVFFLAGNAGILLFSYLNGAIFIINASRYNGFMFLVFVISYWLMNYFPEKSKTPFILFGKLREKFKIEKYGSSYVSLLLAINMLAGGVAYAKDFVNNFSSVQNAGNYIVENNYQRFAMAGFVDYAVSPISAYTRKPIYYPERDSSSTFPIWLATKYSMDNNVIIKRLLDYIHTNHDTVLVVLNFELGTSIIGDVNFVHLISFKESIVKDENHSLYLAAKYNLDKDLAGLPLQLSEYKISSYLDLLGGLLQQNNQVDCEKIISALDSRVGSKSISRYYLYKGMIASRKGLVDEAKKDFLTEINLGLQREQAFLQLGLLYYQYQKLDSALYYLDQTIKINPSNSDALSNMGVIYYNYKKDYVKAEEVWAKAIAINPKYYQVYINLLLNCQTKKDDNCFSKYLILALNNGMSIQDIRSKGIVISDQLLSRLVKQ